MGMKDYPDTVENISISTARLAAQRLIQWATKTPTAILHVMKILNFIWASSQMKLQQYCYVVRRLTVQKVQPRLKIFP